MLQLVEVHGITIYVARLSANRMTACLESLTAEAGLSLSLPGVLSSLFAFVSFRMHAAYALACCMLLFN